VTRRAFVQSLLLTSAAALVEPRATGLALVAPTADTRGHDAARLERLPVGLFARFTLRRFGWR
jgi:hypothetical protein